MNSVDLSTVANIGIGNQCAILLILFADHARLKDYVSQMPGQLEARIQEGGE